MWSSHHVDFQFCFCLTIYFYSTAGAMCRSVANGLLQPRKFWNLVPFLRFNYKRPTIIKNATTWGPFNCIKRCVTSSRHHGRTRFRIGSHVQKYSKLVAYGVTAKQPVEPPFAKTARVQARWRL
ncbi:hypothetical protein RvY_11060 [Ramazzottius varieornatus]|uniref:Uncharacterized protein n=1 Tax=Ramazzottius varieornatus TaxID=947166 RepID=A0A1D1VJ97_RAMVA|nr:hypothetical protein RvY_11060 [Ramazzottius varieornatus]